jgi:hypothetical protein
MRAPRGMFKPSPVEFLFTTLLAGFTLGPDCMAPKTKLVPFHNLAAVRARTAAPPAAVRIFWAFGGGWNAGSSSLVVDIGFGRRAAN